MSERSTLQTVLYLYWGLFVIVTFGAYQLGYTGFEWTVTMLVFGTAMMVFTDD